jgi:hypothetical protein
MRLKQKPKRCSRAKPSDKKPFRLYSFLFMGAFLLFTAPYMDASQIGLKLYAGGSWINGGSLNTHLRDWENYLLDRSIDENYSLTQSLQQFHWMKEVEAEIFYSISSRFRIALAFSFISGSQLGEIDSNLSLEEDYYRSPTDFGTVTTNEISFQEPLYRLRTYPISLILYYTFNAGDNLDIFVGAGASYYSAKLVYEENYEYDFNYTEENTAMGTMLPFNDQYSSTGIYTEEFNSHTIGALLKCGIEYKMSKKLCFVAEILGRWAELTDWEGTKEDSFIWDHTWGYAGENSDNGSSVETGRGTLWLGNYQSDETQKSYYKFVISEQKPGDPILSAEPAVIDLSGISFRIGIKISL